MALKLEGENYKIEWDEMECEWFGYVIMNTKSGEKVGYPWVRVRSSFELEEVMTWVIHYLDELACHHKEQNAQM